ncbi:MAG: riboflavin synthase [Methanobacteriota archaeon]|jgi:riboflavin synthase|nr:MAG: riboflavin synthase [Euryarchaeota archaeon]
MVFTGIVEGTGIVTEIVHSKNLSKLTVQTSTEFCQDIKIGASVCVDGVCLTICTIDNDKLKFDIMMETLSVTTFDAIKEEDIVNIERSMKLGDEIGGHLLSGHVSSTVKISKIETPENNHILTFQTSSDVLKYIFPKGYVALNGVSLTIGEVDKVKKTFNVYLIPETLRLTNLQNKLVGNRINIELETQTRNMVDTISEINKESIHG